MALILIGRDEKTNQLAFTVDNNTPLRTSVQVSNSVSRQHAEINFDPQTQAMTIRNLKPNNFTYVNGLGVLKRTLILDKGTTIELGPNREKVDMNALRQVISKIPREVDIRHLEAVYKKYTDDRLQLQVSERKFNALRSATGVLTLGAMAVSAIMGANGRTSPLFICAYIAATLITIVCFVIAYKKAGKVPFQQQKLQEDFQERYLCPACKHFLRNGQAYNLIHDGDKCQCGATLKK